ncbi:MAG: class I SAM-dependent methyltransferase [Chloroflexi bacterium]|jgi:demethylmenaquinone methyltransferase/2-methoxy-6-polyprenyl-1,4-benzoquinol methylase|nr:class I SAM-dependent methyltransferase [Chloroflexota bacterium]
MAKFDHFNLIGPIYDWIFHRRNPNRLLEMVGLAAHHTLLDIGGGTGRVSSRFRAISPSIIVADPAMKMLKEARKKGLLSIIANSETLPFREQSFDRIIMVDTFHHVADHQLALDEIWRTLKPGGRLVIEEPNIHNLFAKFIAWGEKILFMRSKFFPPEAIVSMGAYKDAENIRLVTKNSIFWVMIDKCNRALE